jgi:hypothetical protein
MEITIFKDIKDTSQPFYRNVNMVLERIEQGNSKEIVKKIRSTKNKEERNELKKQLPAICFSGKFTKRNDASLTEHSGLICLDFDGYNTRKRKDN